FSLRKHFDQTPQVIRRQSQGLLIKFFNYGSRFSIQNYCYSIDKRQDATSSSNGLETVRRPKRLKRLTASSSSICSRFSISSTSACSGLGIREAKNCQSSPLS